MPADTNPLRGPGDVWIGPDTPSGPLCLRCRHDVEVPASALDAGHRTGRVDAETLALALAAVRDHEQGTLDPGPTARETAEDPEYQDWEGTVLAPAAETVTGLASRASAPSRPRPSGVLAQRSWIAVAAALALLCVGLGAWNLTLRRDVTRLSAPVLIGGSQEVAVGDGTRGPVTLRIRPSDWHLLVFVVLEGDAASHERYRVELLDDDGAVVWTSAVVERGALPELNLVVPRELFDRARRPARLVVVAVDEGGDRRLSEIPLRIERTDDLP